MAGALPELDFAGAFNPIANQSALAQFQQEQELMPAATAAKQADLSAQTQIAPIKVQTAQRENALQNIDFQERAIGAVAKRAQAVDPDQAGQVWDQGMKALQSEGVDTAGQYIGRYSGPLAERVGDIYGATKPQGPPPGFDPEGTERAVAQLPPAQRATSLRNVNMAVSGYDRVKDESSWNDELQSLRSAGINPDQFIQPGMNWQMAYMQVRPIIEKLRATQPILQGAVMQDQGGIPNAAAKPLYEPQSTYIGINDQGKPLYHDIHGGPDTVGNESIHPKLSAGLATFQGKYQMAIDSGMTQADAMTFANGKVPMDAGKIYEMAHNAAIREVADEAATSPNPPANFDAAVQERTEANRQAMMAAMSGPAPGAGGAPQPNSIPAQAMKALQNARGKPVRFNNNQTWKLVNGKPVRVN